MYLFIYNILYLYILCAAGFIYLFICLFIYHVYYLPVIIYYYADIFILLRFCIYYIYVFMHLFIDLQQTCLKILLHCASNKVSHLTR